MSSVTITYDYVSFGGGAGYTRQPRSGTGPGGFTLIYQLPGGTADAGNSFAPGAQPTTLAYGGATYDFAFVNVSGGTPAGQTAPAGVTSFSAAAPPAAVTVGTEPIVVLVVYIPVGGDPNGSGSGALIDSFDNTTGQLFSDNFVSVAPDPGGALTKTGNVDGYVDTSKATETITALSPTLPTGVIFGQWAILYPKGSTKVAAAGKALTVDQGASAAALAFYNVDPCAYLRQELANLNPGDFPNFGAYEAAVARVRQQLLSCEEMHGEIPRPAVPVKK